jgi:hypothetical protein
MIAVARFCAAAVMPFLLLACQDNTAPPGPPYLAIVTNLYALGGASAPDEIVYNIRNVGDRNGVSRRLRVEPSDTVLLSLPPASYQVEVGGLPSRCVVSNGALRAIALTDEDNTGVIRYSIQCRGVVSVGVVADGPSLDPSYVFLLRHADGTEYTGLVAANDTSTVDEAKPGAYEVRLGGVASNCTVVSDGGQRQRVTASSTGGASVNFRVTCSDLAKRPQLLSMVGGYDGGASIFTFTVWDPDHDVDGYVWDITDCEGVSVLPDKRERIRRNLLSGRAQASDTLVVVGAYELGLPASALAGRCTEIRVFDSRGNTSVILQHRIGSATGFAPTVRFFNATLQGTSAITSLLAANDPENDIVGHFVLVRLRDGALGPNDGLPDLGSMDPAGYLTLDVPVIPTTGRIRWDDVLAVIVYVIDAKGNVLRIEDNDIFR